MKSIHPAAPRRSFVTLTLVLLFGLSCANYQRIAPEEIAKGDHVHIALWGGGTKRFEVRDVREGMVVGKKTEVAVVEIKAVRRRLPLVEDSEDAGALTAIANSLYYIFTLSWLP